MGKEVKVIQTWYDSIRSRYSRMLKETKASGSGLPELTERQQWILDRFSFLRPFIAPCPRCNIASFKTKVSACAIQTAAASGEDADSENEDDATTDDAQTADAPTVPIQSTSLNCSDVLLDVRPRRDGARREKAEEQVS